MAASLLVRGGRVVPMTGPGVSFAGDVLLEGGRIGAVGSNLSAPAGAALLDASDALVLPGFVQAHVHVVQSLARGRADGLELLAWLRERIFPYEAALARADVAAAARLGIAELLTGGTTAALDMGTVHHQDEVFEAARELGIRFASGKCHLDTGEGVPDALLEEAEASLADADALGRRWHGAADGRLRYAVAPRFALSCSRELLEGRPPGPAPRLAAAHAREREPRGDAPGARVVRQRQRGLPVRGRHCRRRHRAGALHPPRGR
jgi:cytosine/adenosine deaminase-related metal-dependent hydrolase